MLVGATARQVCPAAGGESSADGDLHAPESAGGAQDDCPQQGGHSRGAGGASAAPTGGGRGPGE